jgi:hypothetical protein
VVDDQLVQNYWEHWRLARGDRAQRLCTQRGSTGHESVREAVEVGDPAVVDLLVALAEAAPSEDDAGLIGAGPLEALLSAHAALLATGEGAPLLDAIDVGARRSARFRRALRSAYMGDEVPAAAKSRLQRFLDSPSP